LIEANVLPLSQTANQCHERATLQGVIIPSDILKIVFRQIVFHFVFNAVWALTSGGFHIVSDTLVLKASSNCKVPNPHSVVSPVPPCQGSVYWLKTTEAPSWKLCSNEVESTADFSLMDKH